MSNPRYGVITTRQATRLGPPPPNPDARRREARALLGDGVATLAAVALAWYDGRPGAAKEDLYGIIDPDPPA